MTDQPNASKPAKATSLGRAFQQIGSLTAISRIVGFMRDIAFLPVFWVQGQLPMPF